MNKPWIAIDVDGVLADTVGHIKPQMPALCGAELTDDHLQNYDFEIGGSRFGKILVANQKRPGFIDGVGLNPDARPAVAKLAELFRIAIVTARPVESADWTRDWLTENHIHFDAFHCKGIGEKQNTGLNCIALIDDHTENVLKFMQNTNGIGILFDQSWNRNNRDVLEPFIYSSRCHVAKGWRAVVRHLQYVRTAP